MQSRLIILLLFDASEILIDQMLDTRASFVVIRWVPAVENRTQSDIHLILDVGHKLTPCYACSNPKINWKSLRLQNAIQNSSLWYLMTLSLSIKLLSISSVIYNCVYLRVVYYFVNSSTN